MKDPEGTLFFWYASALYPTWFRWKKPEPRCPTSRRTLYIPHGSDESVHRCDYTRVVGNFISHMVQMKVLQLHDSSLTGLSLYPTWFRWKVFVEPSFWVQGYPLYPTWFRWKLHYQCHAECLSYLYIPHGSDERLRPGVNALIHYDFISHMVQMKGSPLADLYFFIAALYPTWFRWKMAYITSP